MAAIRAGIELNDQFTNVIYGIIDSVNLAVASMYDMQQSINAGIDTGSIESARNEINQAAAAMEGLNQEMQRPPSTIPPVEAPVSAPAPAPAPAPTWDSANIDVFTGTGIERFQQEVQSTNTMLNTLNATQEQIQQTASTMDILPEAAVQDINTIGQRLEAIRTRIQAIESNPVNFGTNQANGELERLREQLNQAIREQNNLNSAMDNMDVSGANAAYVQLSQTVGNTERYIRDNTTEQGNFNQAIQQGISHGNGLMRTIKGAAAAYISIQSIGKLLGISDELTSSTARLNMMNDGLQTTQELTNMVYAAAQNSRGSFSDMAAVVAKFGNNAKDAFSSSEEVVAFAELVQKQMTIAGASTTESSNAMLQLSQALGSGVLRGDELNSIFEQAPNLVQSIADYLDVPIGAIRDMASEGELTADTVKAAIFAASDEINGKFDEMPMTWGQIWTLMGNTAIMAFQPVLQKLNDIANSEAFQNFISGAAQAMATLANVILSIFDLMGQIGSFVSDNWTVIEPIVWGVVAALTAYACYLGIVKGLELLSMAATTLHALAMSAKIGITAALTGETMKATAAQMGYNGALYACPIVWIIVLIIALIAIIFAVCNAIAEMTGIAQSGFGVICGAVRVLVTIVQNLVIGLINSVITWVINFYNMVANFAAAFGVLLDDPVATIKAVVLSMFNFIVGIVTKAASLLDTVFGSNLAEAVSQFQAKIQAEIDATIEGAGGTAAETLDPADYKLDRINYGDAFNKGAEWGDGVSDRLSNMFTLPEIKEDDTGREDVLNDSELAGGVEDIAGNTGAIKDSLDVTEEDLKYLRDMAEQETINRYTVAEISIDQSGMQNSINNGDDIDGFMAKLTDSVNEAVENMTEGVHA